MSRTVVVTGGGTGLGRAIALRFAANDDSVIVTGRRPDPLGETARLGGAAVRAIGCDGTDPDQLNALLAELPETIDVLVNNAGGNTDFDQPDPTDLHSLATQWRTNFDANVVTAVLTTEALSDRLADDATVLSIGSIAADKPAASYGAAKAALASWNLTTAERRKYLVSTTKTHRVGVPSDIAETAFFLASAGARHVTGQVIHVNGGAHTTR